MLYIEGESIQFPDGFGIYSQMTGHVIRVDWVTGTYRVKFFQHENSPWLFFDKEKSVDFTVDTLPERKISPIWRFKIGQKLKFDSPDYQKYGEGVIRNLRVEDGNIIYNVTFSDPIYGKRHVAIGHWDMPECICEARVLLWGCQCGGYKSAIK